MPGLRGARERLEGLEGLVAVPTSVPACTCSAGRARMTPCVWSRPSRPAVYTSSRSILSPSRLEDCFIRLVQRQTEGNAVMRRFLAIFKKEFRQIWRDPLSLGLLVFIPALHARPLRLRPVVRRQAHPHGRAGRRPHAGQPQPPRQPVPAIPTSTSRRTLSCRAQADAVLSRGQVRAVLIVPRGYARDARSRPDRLRSRPWWTGGCHLRQRHRRLPGCPGRSHDPQDPARGAGTHAGVAARLPDGDPGAADLVQSGDGELPLPGARADRPAADALGRDRHVAFHRSGEGARDHRADPGVASPAL